MRKVVFSIVSLSLFLLCACQADDSPTPSTSQMILGKWRLQKAIDEYYHPVNVLLETENVDGEIGDSVIFKSNNEVYSYSLAHGEEVTTYEILNDTTIKIEDELYKIRRLTNQELHLYMEETDPVLDERYIQKLYFLR
ncbi:MAG TPA: hypothetical protein VGD17_17970 [Chitinophagaceae bacterium]